MVPNRAKYDIDIWKSPNVFEVVVSYCEEV